MNLAKIYQQQNLKKCQKKIIHNMSNQKKHPFAKSEKVLETLI